MKRDMDLVRGILLYVEEHNAWQWRSTNSSPIAGYTPAQVTEHIGLLIQGGLLDGKDMSTLTAVAWHNLKLTWQGHDFIELARSDTRWGKARDTILNQGLAVTVEVISEMLRRMMLGTI